MTDLSGRLAVITGGARGQGRSHALTLAKAGADIAICDACKPWNVPYEMPTEKDLAETVEAVEALGRRCIGVRADVTIAAEMEAFVAKTVETFGRIDIVLANAGVYKPWGPLWEVSEEHFDETIAVDLKGVWLTCKYTFPHLLERGGSVVLTSSMAGERGYPNVGAYVAAKHGVLGLMKTLANEGAPYGIRVNALMPGSVDTPMTFNEEQYQLFSPDDPSRPSMEKVMDGMVPLKGMAYGDVSDMSAAVKWLCSDDARFVTGIGLPVAGGHNAAP